MTSKAPQTHQVVLLPAGLTFTQADSNRSLLQSALAAAIRLPNSCRNGTCRTCMCKMVSGNVDYQIEWPGLTREEKNEGWILPCVAVASSDLVLDVPAAINLNV
ncbi:2Fe-2S iron-sulfur cluster-binding protein [Herbaspirillum sp. alder98]|uniref:2Fe-2S iron-sulfur cluster-binding protein n=1 Tax=Herbaspirillum sp. alder98 TaxID=2913096 RepID=UPI001CD8B3B0|nr:2Fe-2S iron-sulfur cluster-binding protein [Herbaspirillum sp. alder98]MCA1325887.1 2Fe-2S iron-sulfur cluster binding domain-containing protein [Herbaspirillum sp. alder98]